VAEHPLAADFRTESMGGAGGGTLGLGGLGSGRAGHGPRSCGEGTAPAAETFVKVHHDVGANGQK
jgi:hypothetical protein